MLEGDAAPIYYNVDYFCDSDLIANQSPTKFLPRKGDQVMFSKDGDTYTAEIFEVENVMIVIPEQDGEVYNVTVALEATS